MFEPSSFAAHEVNHFQSSRQPELRSLKFSVVLRTLFAYFPKCVEKSSQRILL